MIENKEIANSVKRLKVGLEMVESGDGFDRAVGKGILRMHIEWLDDLTKEKEDANIA